MPRARKAVEPDEATHLAEQDGAAHLARQEREPEPAGGAREGEITLSAQQISTLLHEVRNPLTALNTLAKLLQKRLPPEDRNHWIGLSIEQECKHLQELLTEFERSDGIPATLKAQPLALADLLREWIPVYQALAETQGHHFQAEVPTQLPFVQADPRALRQVLDNLIDNACKYTPAPGQIRINTALQTHTQPTAVLISVCDTGPGIHPENLERIFDPFFRVDPSKPGQGLGLAISRDLATQMGGQLQVRSTPQGSCFHLKLPLA